VLAAVELISGLERSDGIQDGDVGHMAAILEQIAHPAQKTI